MTISLNYCLLSSVPLNKDQCTFKRECVYYCGDRKFCEGNCIDLNLERCEDLKN